MGRYLPGNRVVIDFTFEPYEGEPGDPETVTATLRNPVTAAETDLADDLTDPIGDGTFTVSYLIPDDAQAGDYRVRLQGVGNNRDAAIEHVFTVEDSLFDGPPDVVVEP